MGESVYTPYNSFKPINRGVSSAHSKGIARYNFPDGTIKYSYMYSSYNSISKRTGVDRPRYGTIYSLQSPKRGVGTINTKYLIDYESRIMTKIAYRACKITPSF